MLKNQVMLTTSDNPYNPFTDWDSWYQFDTSHGYNTIDLLGRISMGTHVANDMDTYYAMRTIVEKDLYGKHLLVTKAMANAVIAAQQ